MSKIKTWMPVYIGDYLADTMRLTTLQHGAYFLLMMEYWRQGPLPDDMDELCAIARADRKAWDKSIWPTLKRFFSKGEDGLLHQKRADIELAHAQSVSNKRRDAVQQRRDRSSTKEKQTGNKTSTKEDTNVTDLNIQNANKEGDTCASCASASPSPSHSSLRSEDPSLRSGPEAEARTIGEAENSLDARTQLFTDGTQRIRHMTGLPERNVRALIGRWLKLGGDDAACVLDVIRQASDLRPADPQAWCEAAVRHRASGAKPKSRQQLAAETWANVPDIEGV
ncbi:YdaU family protein [Acetobacter senegalensis]|uniref:YdaU family protein n=1 Tax=Acetobacter senegalensis TaxID=446692 RepID=UPI001EDBE69C|nr:DUF1376 domain-containing protein [Acetobacter senegalensis]MCG4258185.1 YdaU family protein [Acetobacter senegalensis]MCG4268112.1 YdaU family protein [Acetobacter senegalensis]